MRKRLLVFAALGLSALVSCGENNGDQNPPRLFAGVPTKRDTGWTFEQSVDPITDASVLTATKSVLDEDQSFKAQFVFTCTVDKQRANLQLEVSLFDKDDTGVAVRQQQTIWGFSAFQYALRFDQNDPISTGAFMRNFSNQIILLSLDSESPSGSSAVRYAKKLALAVSLESGDPTFVSSLEDDDVEQVLEGCGAVFNQTKEDVTNVKEPAERVNITPQSMVSWVSELRTSGTLKQANDALRSHGVIDQRFYEGDYSASYYKLQKDTTFLGSGVSAILLAEDKPNTMGCCSQPEITLYLKDSEASGELSSFASKNGCIYRKLSDQERADLMRSYDFSKAFAVDDHQLVAVLECRKPVVN